MSLTYTRRYTGPLKAVVLDWAGTTVDHGCMAPAETFIAAFAAMGVEITTPQAREPMGLPKWRHIQAITRMAPVAAAWTRSTARRRPTPTSMRSTPASCRCRSRPSRAIPTSSPGSSRR